ncbi:MAG: alkaline phosphatase [Bacteroidales bacterium]
MKTLSIIIGSLLLIFSCSNSKSQKNNSEEKTPKYIFLFIGDGMGLVQAQATDTYLRTTAQDSLTLMYLPGKGYMTTHSANSPITGSAASGTAISSGSKTNNGMLGMSPQNDTLHNLMETAHQHGFKTGIVTSVSLDHATPGAFYAHTNSRHNYHEIGTQLAQSNIDFCAGGGFLEPKQNNANIYEIAKNNGYTLINSYNTISTINSDSRYMLYDTLTAFPYAINKQHNNFTLQNTTQTAIDYLYTKNENHGFVLMVEGGKIDWACHQNDAATTIHEVIDFNNAVKEAISFYNEHPNETLIIVTADHETGGMTLGNAVYPYELHANYLSQQHISYDMLEDTLQKIWKKNPDIRFSKLYKIINQFYSLDGKQGISMTKDDIQSLQDAYNFVINKTTHITQKEALERYNCSHISAKPEDKIKAISITINRIIAEKSGIGWTTYAHTASQVPVYSLGAGNKPFTDLIDNTDIAQIISQHITQQQK